MTDAGAKEPEIDVAPLQSWQRFGMCDLVLCLASLIAGHFWNWPAHVWAQDNAMSAGLGSTLAAEEFSGVVAVLVGAIEFTGPVILISHFVRGRRRLLSPGEWLWIVPILVGSLLAALNGTDAVVPALLLSGLVLLASMGLGAILLLVDLLHGMRGRPCVWTDRFGTCCCMFSVSFVFLNLHVHPPQF